MALHLPPMSSREQASACVLAVSIAVLVWIGAFGCISSPSFAFNHADLVRVRGAYEGMSLKEFQEVLSAAVPAGRKVVDGMEIDAYVRDFPDQESVDARLVQRKWYFFHEKRLVVWGDQEDWIGAANESTKRLERQKAEAVRAQQRLEAAKAEQAARNAPMGDSW